VPDKIRSFWGAAHRDQAANSLDIDSQRVLELRADHAYHLTGYRFGWSARLDEGFAAIGDNEQNFSAALSAWLPSTTMSVESSLDSRQTQAGLFAFAERGTIDVLTRRNWVESGNGTGISATGDMNGDSGWVPCDLIIPQLVLTEVTEVINVDITWQMFVVFEWELTGRLSADRMVAINQNWAVPKARHETTW